MITKELAMTLRIGQELWHSTLTNKDGTPLRARVNGKCKTWKRTPESWKLPVKYGMDACFYIGTAEVSGATGIPHNWSLPERWEIERHYRS